MVVHDLKECLPKEAGKLGPITVIEFNDGQKDFGYITGIVSAQIEFNGKWINRGQIAKVNVFKPIPLARIISQVGK